MEKMQDERTPDRTQEIGDLLEAWADATQEDRDEVTDLLEAAHAFEKTADVSMLVYAREILTAAGEGELKATGTPETDPETVASLLMLVIEVVPEKDTKEAGQILQDLVGFWKPAERAATANWASAVHLSASDNDDVEVPERPEVVGELLSAQRGSVTTVLALRKARARRMREMACLALGRLTTDLATLKQHDAGKAVNEMWQALIKLGDEIHRW